MEDTAVTTVADAVTASATASTTAIPPTLAPNAPHLLAISTDMFAGPCRAHRLRTKKKKNHMLSFSPGRSREVLKVF